MQRSISRMDKAELNIKDHSEMELLLNYIRNHDKLAIFLDPNFNTNNFASEIIAKDSTQSREDNYLKSFSEEYLQLLRENVTKIDQLIHTYVGLNHENLLVRAGKTVGLRNKTANINNAVDELTVAMSRIERDIVSPYEDLKQMTNELERVQKASEILRKTSRFHQLLEKLSHEISDLTTQKETISFSTSERIITELQEIRNVPEVQELEIIASKLDTLDKAIEQIDYLKKKKLGIETN